MTISPQRFTSKYRLGRLLRFVRNKRKATLLDVAIVTGIDQTRLSRIERGVLAPRDEELKVLAAELDMDNVQRSELWRFRDDVRSELKWRSIVGGDVDLSEVHQMVREAWDKHQNFKYFRRFQLEIFIPT